METSSSKVTVEYHDPSGVFNLISNEIASRLPLRNLNWQSPARPLRQIKSLHLDFVPDKETQTSQRSPAPATETDGSQSSLEIVRSGKDGKKEGTKERRHQIPGLKTSPYLKLYILRCDDKESYKDTQQKKIREWVRENAQADKQRDNHDASEWMIVHVVIPDTVAASEPRWKEPSASNDSDELKERSKAGAKWVGKSTRTVFDRLRADFNESNKTAQDRISQIRLRKTEVPQDLLPTPALATTLNETAQERENAWNDLVGKVKTLILNSFDLRVRRYEDDVAEQESRRSLPGWNFCTFFIHKEGLAKALESIGLVEDALAIYDELALGLETVVRDIASGEAEGTATTFAEYTKDIERRILGTSGPYKDTSNEDDRSKFLQGLFNKDYRQNIVTSTISVFDFFCYLFSRQKALVLRLANSRGIRAELGGLNIKDGGEDLVLLSEVCWRASSFLHNNTRTLRQDLLNGKKGSTGAQAEADINSLVFSWAHAVAEQVLMDTSGSALETASVDTVRKTGLSNGTTPRPVDFGFAMGADPYPQRTSSITARRKWPVHKSTVAPNRPDPPAFSPRASDTELTKPVGIPGQPDLATYRAELIMLQRKMLEHLALQRQWTVGWPKIQRGVSKPMEEVSLDEDKTIANEQDASNLVVSHLISPLLTDAINSETTFQAEYESLSYKAMHYYVLATITKAAEALVIDLALLKHHQAEFEEAKTFFEYVLPQYAGESWNIMEAHILAVYSESLSKLGKKDDYAKAMLKLLSKVCEHKMSQPLPRNTQLHPELESDSLDVSGFLPELISHSAELSKETTSPMAQYFADIHPDQEIKHQESNDGFSLGLNFRHILSEGISIDSASARLTSMNDPTQEIWLTSDEAVEISPGPVRVNLKTTAVTFGAYFIDRIALKVNMLTFVHEMHPAPTVPTLIIGDAEASLATSEPGKRRPFVFVFPPPNAFNAVIGLSQDFHIEKRRQLEISIESGWNRIESLDLRLRPTTAGLRLHLADATFNAVERRAQAEVVVGQIPLGALKSRESAKIHVPYTFDHQGSGQSLSVRLEARYHTTEGSFTFLTSAKVTADLPLDVDVNDIFHVDTLYSKFTLRTTQGSPISIIDAELEGSKVYDVEAPPPFLSDPMLVLDKQPGKLIYKITRKAGSFDTKFNKKDAALALKLQYHPVDELITAKFQSQFKEDVYKSPFAPFTGLLAPLFTDRSRQILLTTTSQIDLAFAALTGETKTPTYKDIDWDEIVRLLPSDVRSKLSDWLREWHDNHKILAINKLSGDETRPRCITIAVDIPNIDFVHSASLTLSDLVETPSRSPPILVLGESNKALLSIKHTTSWAVDFGHRNNKKDEDISKHEFVYEVHAEADTWLVGGPRRGHFTASANGEIPAVELVLIPLKLGLCSLPHVEVQAATPETGISDQKGATAPATQLPSCETHYESSGQIVQIIRDQRSTKIQIGETQTIVERPSTSASEA